MRWPQATDPQFLDALGVGGLNQAYGTVSGSIASVGSGAWALPGLLAPEAMGVTFNNLVATVTLPSPWGVVTSGGVVVRAHGTQTGVDTQSYSVNFSAARPASGSATAYLAATIQQIQQDPFPIPGPPQGFPSFNPNYVPTTGYATNLYTVALTAVTGAPNNVSSFELLRTTLTAGQASISTYSTVGWTLAADRKAFPNSILGSGGALNPTQLQQIIVPSVAGLTFTLPAVQIAGGLPASFANSTNGNCTVAASGTDRISGLSGGNVVSITLPPSGGVLMIGNAPQGLWEVIGFNTATNNVWSGTNTFNDSTGQGGPVVQALSSGGAAIKLIGNGATTPSKYIRAINGIFDILNNAYTVELFRLDDAGNAAIAGNETVGGNLTVAGSTQTNGITSFGTSSQFYVNPNNSGNQLINFAANQFLQFQPATGFLLNTTGRIDLNAPANVNVSNNLIVGSNTFFGTGGQFYAAPGTNPTIAFANNQYLQFQPALGFVFNTTGVIDLIAPAGVNASNTIVSAGNGSFNGVIAGLLGDGNYGISTPGGAYFDYDTNSATAAFGGWFSPIPIFANNVIAITGVTYVNMYAANFVVSSDEKHKTNVRLLPVEDAIAFITDVPAKTFTRNGHTEAGFVAQDIQDTSFDHMVRKMGQNPDHATSNELGLNTTDPIAYHHTALRFLLERIDVLEKKIKDMESARS